MDFSIMVDANVEFVRRVSTRWADAAAAVEKGTYAPQQLIQDAFASVVTDPLTWTSTLLRAVVVEPGPSPSAAPPNAAGGSSSPKAN